MQLELFMLDEQALRRSLESHTGMRLELAITNNSSSMMSFQPSRKGRPAKLRLHRMFLRAEPAVVEALGRWLVRGRCKRSGAVLDRFIENHTHLIERGERRRRSLRPKGRVHDLDELYREVNLEHFSGSIAMPITWGRWPNTRRRRSIRLGSYTPEDHLIRIHPCLDQEFVPRFFVRYIVFHEMLHVHVGIECAENGRRRVHTPEFKRLERAYPDYDRAVAWQDAKGNLERLIRSRPPAQKAS